LELFTPHAAVRLALFYFARNPSSDTAVVLVRPFSQGASLAPTADHGILGLTRAMNVRMEIRKSRIVVVAPGFTDTSLLGIPPRDLAASSRNASLTTAERVAGAVILGATDPSPNINGSVYAITDEYPVFRIHSLELSLREIGLFKLLFGRIRSLFEIEQKVWNSCKWVWGLADVVSGWLSVSKP